MLLIINFCDTEMEAALDSMPQSVSSLFIDNNAA